MRAEPPRRVSRNDFVAGVSVALVLVPQSMAYAELAGLPAHHGLYAASLPLIAAAFLASSPYLQTGPVALTGLLTLGALTPLAPEGTAEYAALAALLALVVGVARLLVGLLKAGWLVYLMSHSMMTGFLSAAAILILSSQVPGAFGVAPPVDGVLQRAWWAITTPDAWEPASIALTLLTVAIVAGGRRLHPLVPGVLIAAVAGLLFSVLSGYSGRTVGEIPRGLPPLSLDLPFARLPSLILPGIVISVVGFAEGVSISRLYASQDRQRWDADREFLSKGIGNLVAGLTSGLPVGGSLSRTSVNRLAGARSRWSGLITGATVLVFLPFAWVLGPLPRAVLSGIVIAAIWNLIRPRALASLWALAPAQALVGWVTFALTLILAPHIDRAILLGVALAAGVHLWRELTPKVDARREGDTLYLEPSGVLWFGSAPALEDLLHARLAEEPEVRRVVLRCGGLGRIDLTGAHTLREMITHAAAAGISMSLVDVPEHAVRVLSAVGAHPKPHDGGPAKGTGAGTSSAGAP